MNKQANNEMARTFFPVRTHTSKAEARAIPPFAPRRRCLRSRCFSWMFFKKNDTGVMSKHLQAARYTFLPVISNVSECSEIRKVSYLVLGVSLSDITSHILFVYELYLLTLCSLRVTYRFYSVYATETISSSKEDPLGVKGTAIV